MHFFIFYFPLSNISLRRNLFHHQFSFWLHSNDPKREKMIVMDKKMNKWKEKEVTHQQHEYFSTISYARSCSLGYFRETAVVLGALSAGHRFNSISCES